uniref:Glutaredoxin and cysteine rich domain containing 2 n=1 Tax=Amphiprion percula TaxID=161767 RepID=A0A3P8TP29_AMPPE
MEELQRKLNQRYEGTKPRKVRFKLASSYSGRVLKHVYEDGQELDSPEEKYPHSFVHRVYSPTGLIAQRINVYRGMGSYKPAASQTNEAEGDDKSSVLDFGKIIIYTSNLRIIRAPAKKPDSLRHHTVSSLLPPLPPLMCFFCLQEADSCQHCGGSGCAPCSLCHGSKLSMLANRFNESISDLRCQACYPHGLEKCQSCSSK